MINKRNKMSIKRQTTFAIIIAMLIPTIILTISLVYSLNLVSQKSKQVASDNLLRQVKDSIKFETQIVVSNSQTLFETKKNEISENDLINIILENIRNTKYGESGYYFVYRYDGVRLVAPEDRTQEGKNLIDKVDENGVKMVQGFIQNSKNGGDFLSYNWKNPKTNNVELKIAYIMPLKLGSQEYAIGTGTYLPMIEATKTEIGNTIKKTMDDVLLITLPIYAGMTLLIIFTTYRFFSRKIIKPVLNFTKAAERIAIGDVDVKIDEYGNGEIGLLGDAFTTLIQNIRDQANIAQKIAQGNLDIYINQKSDQDILAISMKQVINNLNELVSDTQMLTVAAVQGKLTTRADASKHKGDYCKIVEGVNATLDSVIGPLNIAMMQLNKMANGDNLETLENNYQGDYLILIDNINRVKDSLNEMLVESDKLTTAAKNGDLSKRANISNLKGGYKTIVQGINDTLDAVIKPIQESAMVLDEMSKGNLQVMVRGEYQGDHAKIKNSLNDTISILSSYIDEISTVLTEIANGNLVVEITNDYIGDFTQIKDSLNYIIKSFNEILNDINDAADQVAAGSRQVSNSAQALSQGTTEQASSIEELTASIDEIASKTKQNAVSANQANILTLEAKQDAEKGNIQMNDMLIAMDQINETSTNISKIIKVIDEIAFQTNILALNAAVEAARAGQHGKGFAVVAEEVRNLAARSANAAKETTNLIEGSVKKVRDGSKLANETSVALSKIFEGVTKAATLVGSIAEASNEQANGIAQVNKGIMQVSDVIQTNSATSEESAAASEELSSQAEVLNGKIRRFNLKRIDMIYDNNYNKTSSVAGILPDSSNKEGIKLLKPNKFDKY